MFLRTFIIVLLLFQAGSALAGSMEAGDVHVMWNSNDDLKEFNDNVYFSSSFSLFGGSSGLTVKEEVQNKITRIYAKVQQILRMPMPGIKVNLQILHSAAEVRAVYLRQYRRRVEFIAFYSPKANTVYISAPDVTLRVVGHELGHSVIEHYFHPSPPVNIHELMAQYVEKYIDE